MVRAMKVVEAMERDFVQTELVHSNEMVHRLVMLGAHMFVLK